MGEVLAAFCSSWPSVLQPLIAEAMALWKTMTIAKDLGFTNVEFEGDCKLVVVAINSNIPFHDAISPIVFDIHQMLRSDQHWKVSYAPREQNRRAYCLANLGCNSNLETICVEDYPPFIPHVVQEEMQSSCLNFE